MRLKRTLNRRVGEKEYYKWMIADLPPTEVEQLGWKVNEELRGEIRDGKFVVEKDKRKRK